MDRPVNQKGSKDAKEMCSRGEIRGRKKDEKRLEIYVFTKLPTRSVIIM